PLVRRCQRVRSPAQPGGVPHHSNSATRNSGAHRDEARPPSSTSAHCRRAKRRSCHNSKIFAASSCAQNRVCCVLGNSRAIVSAKRSWVLKPPEWHSHGGVIHQKSCRVCGSPPLPGVLCGHL